MVVLTVHCTKFPGIKPLTIKSWPEIEGYLTRLFNSKGLRIVTLSVNGIHISKYGTHIYCKKCKYNKTCHVCRYYPIRYACQSIATDRLRYTHPNPKIREILKAYSDLTAIIGKMPLAEKAFNTVVNNINELEKELTSNDVEELQSRGHQFWNWKPSI